MNNLFATIHDFLDAHPDITEVEVKAIEAFINFPPRDRQVFISRYQGANPLDAHWMVGFANLKAVKKLEMYSGPTSVFEKIHQEGWDRTRAADIMETSISAWHRATKPQEGAQQDARELHEYLGMTLEEYGRWVENPVCLGELYAAWRDREYQKHAVPAKEGEA